MQNSPASSGNGPSQAENRFTHMHSSGEAPHGLGTTLFPVPGARQAGGGPVGLQPLLPSQPTQEEMERHQRSANGAGPDDVYRLGHKKTYPSILGAIDYPAVPSSSTTLRQSTDFPAHCSPSSPHPPPSMATQTAADPVASFLAGMPTQNDDPSRHALWTELIRLKTRSLELEIAEARRREKEAELELLRLKEGVAAKSASATTDLARSTSIAGLQPDLAQPPIAPAPQLAQHPHPTHPAHPSVPYIVPSQTDDPSLHATSSSDTLAPPQELDHMQNLFGLGQQALSPFDLEAMLQGDNLDNMLSWLPDLGDSSTFSAPDPSLAALPPPAPSTVVPSDLSTNLMPFASGSIYSATNPNFHPRPYAPYVEPKAELQDTSPTRARSASPDESAHPPAKKTKRGEKKAVLERSATCTACSKPLSRVLIRAPRSQIPTPISIQIKCVQCRVIDQPSTLPDSSSSNTIGTVETRKRMRTSMEIDDEEAKLTDRRLWCDVCQRIIGSGQIVGGDERESITAMTELVCAECDGKYQRCTDCGGGGGPRIGIGKWRMKQVFHPGRKTCSLSHTRLGDRTRELGVHVTPTDFTPEQLKGVLTRCKALWNEKTVSRLAVPEMLEIDLPASLSNPLRDFADVDDIVTRNWPSREAMIRADGVDPNRFKRLLGLIWAHSKPRRSVKTVDLEEEWTKQAEENEDDDMSTVLANVKRTNVVIPPGSELIGMWGSEWNMLNGSLLISTFIPFEGADGEDSTALSVGEMITKVQGLQQEINAERLAQAERAGPGTEAKLLPPCEHLWTVSGGYIPLVRERFADILIRKRAFVHVEEYLSRHPEFIDSIRARPVGLHPDIHRPLPLSVTRVRNGQGGLQGEGGGEGDDGPQPHPLILVRWLGKEFDAQKILEIKQMEFGGKKKRKVKV